MKIAVCVKVCKGELNPFDASALECALTLSKDVTVVSMGPESAEKVLLPLTRLGAKAVLVTDSVYAGSDTLVTAKILCEALKKIGFDLILCGRQSVDGDTGQVGPMLSACLDIPLITGGMQVAVTNEKAVVSTRFGTEETVLPALITVERSYVLRFPSIFSKIGQVERLSNGDLNLNPEVCGLKGSPTRVLETKENEQGKRKCTFISMEELEPLVQKLRNETSLTETATEAEQKLKSVWAIGEAAAEKAKHIAENVVILPESDPKEIAEKAKQEKPEVILWNADPWGRKNAPISAVMLDTGLCADCTGLDTDGEQLFMIRPAQGGNITAKIKCLTRPQMATVRTKSESADVVVSSGRGIKDSLAKVKALAERLNAEIGASRGLVDEGGLPYESQVGLTGKTVSPKVYIAIGISGAVHHTCAIEGAGTVIAINPDKDARIFEYADYGIIAEF